MADAREAILAGRYAAWRREFLSEYAPIAADAASTAAGRDA